MVNREVDGTRMSTVGEGVTVNDLTKIGLRDMAANPVTVRTALVRVPRTFIGQTKMYDL